MGMYSLRKYVKVCALHQDLLPSALKLLSKSHCKKVVHISLQQGVGTCQKHPALSTVFYTSLSALGKMPSYLLYSELWAAAVLPT